MSSRKYFERRIRILYTYLLLVYSFFAKRSCHLSHFEHRKTQKKKKGKKFKSCVSIEKECSAPKYSYVGTSPNEDIEYCVSRNEVQIAGRMHLYRYDWNNAMRRHATIIIFIPRAIIRKMTNVSFCHSSSMHCCAKSNNTVIRY